MRFVLKHFVLGLSAALLFASLSGFLATQSVGDLPQGINFVECIYRICLDDGTSSNLADESDLNHHGDAMHLAVVACGNRLEETLVNVKSSLLFTKSKIVFHIFAEEELHTGFKKGIDAWPLWYRRNFIYTLYPITYPDDGNQKNWKKLFKPCASQRLFLPLVLDKVVDSVLYIDTDILFLTDVKDFWNFFNSFNTSQLSSLCVEHNDKSIGWYNRFARHPYYGLTGVNSGVMLMNLSRIRNAHFKNDLLQDEIGWSEMLLPLYNKYRYNITWGDQDLLNIVFHHNPEMLHIFPCQWNYRPDHCMYSQTCKEAREEGVKILHGNRGVYHNEKQPAFRAVYETIRDFKFQQNYTKYIIELRSSQLCGLFGSKIFECFEAEGWKLSWKTCEISCLKLKPMHHENCYIDYRFGEPLEDALSRTVSTYCGKEKEAMLKGLRQSVKKARVPESWS